MEVVTSSDTPVFSHRSGGPQPQMHGAWFLLPYNYGPKMGGGMKTDMNWSHVDGSELSVDFLVY